MELNKNKLQKSQNLELKKGVRKMFFELIKSILVFIVCFLMLECSFGFLDLVLKSIEGL